MKPFTRSILITGVFAMAANSLIVAQPTPQQNTAYLKATPTQAVAPVNAWFEGWYRAKYGRPSPTEEARLQAQQANTAYREATPAQAAAHDNSRFEAWYRDKYGRPSPTEEARLKAQAR